MNRAHWQALAEERIVAAQCLLAAHQWSSAYYLAGYAVEFGLKSCILVHVENTGVIFEQRTFSEKCWTHDLEQLVGQAGLKAALDAEIVGNPTLANNWAIAFQWTEKSRYQNKTQGDAESLLNALNSHPTGVMPWIRVRW